MNKVRKTRRKNCAVSEVLGTILLLLISVSLFSAIYLTLFSIDVKVEAPTVDLIGSVEDNYLVVEHRGGKSLSLDTKIMINFNSNSHLTFKINEGNFLDNNSKTNGKWDIGESFKYPLINLTNFSRFDPVDVMVVDQYSNSIIMSGVIEEARTADIKIDIDVSDNEPTIGNNIEIYLKVNNNGPSDVQNLTVKFLLHGSLKHESNETTPGTYDDGIGIWDVGSLSVGSYAFLNITANVESSGYSYEFKQLAIILDGSGSIANTSWDLAKKGLADAIRDDEIFPHDNTVELTVVQFGVDRNDRCARREVGPIIVKKNNYKDLADDIEEMDQGKGYTPTAAGISLTTELMVGSSNFGGFNPNYRQILTLVTDGNANIHSEPGVICGSGKANVPIGQKAAYKARNYMIDRLYLNPNQDEFDIIAVDPGENHKAIAEEWLKDMCWPQGTNNTWPPEGPGWYRYVQDWQNFSDSIKEHFEILFRRIENRAEIIGASYSDPNSNNNWDMITIYPKKAQS